MKRDRIMLRTTMPTRAASVVLAAALAFTLMPADAIAYGAENAPASSDMVQAAPAASDAQAAESGEAAERSSEVVSAEHPINDTPDANANGAAADSASSAEAASSAIVAKTVPVQQAAQNASGEQDPTEGVDIVSASVQLANAPTVTAARGMQFALDNERHTATLVGIANSTLQGQLDVPAELQAAGATYTVTNIGTRNVAGGGSLN